LKFLQDSDALDDSPLRSVRIGRSQVPAVTAAGIWKGRPAMVKKLAFGTLAVAAVGSFVFGRDVWSIVATGADNVREAVRSNVPVEFEIGRARKEVENLTPEIRRSLHVIAEQEVEVQNLRASIARQEQKLGSQEEAILSLSSDLKSGGNKFIYASRTYDRKAVQKDLSDRFNRFKLAQDAAERDRQSLAAKEQALESMKTKLEEMLSARKDLEVEIDRLEARLRSVEAAETIAHLEIDDSQLSRARSLISEIHQELDVRQKMVDAESNFTGTIPVEQDQAAPENIEEEVATYFSGRDEVIDAGALVSHQD
jgi:chromosome segregation ATPase